MRRPVFNSYYRRLKRLFPTRRKLRVYFVPADKLHKEHGFEVHGDYHDSPTGGVIRIADDVPEDQAVDTLTHEASHFLSRRKRHGKQFWETHGRIYRALFGD
ncbi:MAG: hypothetical protein KGL39_34825 [Patescibacteria group bacterium]|nr:hypothetical protein [Patescibacteria group bacterium]